MSRYEALMDIANDVQPKHVVEIGAWRGERAAQFMGLTNCYYTGFDLFELATKELDERELNVKRPYEMVDVAKNLQAKGFSKFALIRGDTRETLAKWDVEPFDFAFIDGGHSVETIKNDYEFIRDNISPGGVIILDDYYSPEKVGFGCNFLKDEGEVIPFSDPVAGGGTVSLLRVDR